MILSRRKLIGIGGVLLAGLVRNRAVGAATTGDVVEIGMRGDDDGSKVWFDPVGLLVQPGQTVRWTNEDPGNAHTATAYHPDNQGRPLRIPAGARPWNSDYLLPGERFEVTLTEPGIYDYFCIPHEMAGMVGRIVVGRPSGPGARPTAGPSATAIPDVAARAFPNVEDIVRLGAVRGG